MGDKSITTDTEVLIPEELFEEIPAAQADSDAKAKLIMDEHQALVVLEFIMMKKRYEFYHALQHGHARPVVTTDVQWVSENRGPNLLKFTKPRLSKLSAEAMEISAIVYDDHL